jgi:hypothetical protein
MNGADPTSLYRHFAADGSLLYVGISLSWPARTKAHANSARWFDQVARVEIEQFPTRAAALEAERAAIKLERPKFNVIHNCGTGDAPKKSRGSASGTDAGADPLCRAIPGPHAIVGPPLVYHGNTISVMVVHGEFGSAGELTEVVLGELAPEMPVWAGSFDTVLAIRGADEITIDEARSMRLSLLKRLAGHLRVVQAFDTDLALAVAYASQFPSEKSRKVLDEVAIERVSVTSGLRA